jgi:hypothetical protein
MHFSLQGGAKHGKSIFILDLGNRASKIATYITVVVVILKRLGIYCIK